MGGWACVSGWWVGNFRAGGGGNSKLQIPNPKKITNPKSQITKTNQLSVLSGADGSVDFAGFFGREKFFHEGEGEVDCRAGATRGDNVAVDNNALVQERGGEFVVDGGVAGVAAGG